MLNGEVETYRPHPRPRPQLSKGLKVIGGVLMFLAYSLYAFFYDSFLAQQINMFGLYFGIALVMLGVGLGSDVTIRDRYLFYFPIALFYTVIFFSYLINLLVDYQLKTMWTIYPAIIMLLICLAFYFNLFRSTSTR